MVTYSELVGRRVSTAEANLVTALREEWHALSAGIPLEDSALISRVMKRHELSLCDTIAILLAEDCGPDHALIERIEAIRLIIEARDKHRGGKHWSEHRKDPFVRACNGLMWRIERCFNVTRTEAYRDVSRSNVALLPEPFRAIPEAVAKAAPAARETANRTSGVEYVPHRMRPR